MITRRGMMNLNHHSKSCYSCRYLRFYKTGCDSAECLLCGTLAVGDTDFVMNSARERVCDYWKKRPKKWNVRADKNPFWHDKYIKRQTLQNIVGRIEKKVKAHNSKPEVIKEFINYQRRMEKQLGVV